MFILREQDKHFLWSLLAAMGLIFVWKGLWEGIYYFPYLDEHSISLVALFIGFAMLTFSGIIFREFDPLGGLDQSVGKIIKTVRAHPDKAEFSFKYYDKIRKKPVEISAERIKKLEKGTLIIKHLEGNEEVFIPAHRIIEVLYKGKVYWRL